MRSGTSGPVLVTGAHGCIGAWTVGRLLADGAEVVIFDASDDPHRLRLVLEPEQIDGLVRIRGDVTDLAAFERALDEHDVTTVIHLAALQVPFCRADPPLGASVNVVGTINVFEAVARRADRMGPVVYASSIAAYDGPPGVEPPGGAALAGRPSTLYGVYKRATEAAAAVYWTDRGVTSVGLRPHTVYGPGRDQGVTSAPTFAMLAAAAGRPFRLPFGGRYQLQYAPDAAAAFVRAATRPQSGASVHNLAGHVVHSSGVIASIERAAPAAAGAITFEETILPFPEEVDATSLPQAVGDLGELSLDEGVADAIARFRTLLERGLVDVEGLERVSAPA